MDPAQYSHWRNHQARNPQIREELKERKGSRSGQHTSRGTEGRRRDDRLHTPCAELVFCDTYDTCLYNGSRHFKIPRMHQQVIGLERSGGSRLKRLKEIPEKEKERKKEKEKEKGREREKKERWEE
ncbi:Hypothetical predicted protein [Octopus vulgaris]|uniref:Uncharacterized protein n=1 Tax=Octopus vulgaris TaxID=6645 RepID=A0AA36FA86_OCTVU|nr:Hypothetical predicted protein [Octopus vulgaris]